MALLCEFCDKEVYPHLLGNHASNEVAWHSGCLQKAVKALAKTAEVSSVRVSKPNNHEYIIISPEGRKIFDSLEQAQHVASKLARENVRDYYVAYLTTHHEPIKY